MYNPAHFTEKRPELLHALMRDHPLGALVTLGSTGLDANHIPFEFDPTPTAAAPHGTLTAHVARANPVWKDFSPDYEVLVIFQGAQAYITPSWYESKKEHGKVVPTYNYCVVHAHGKLRAIEDAAWLHAMVTRLTARHESTRPASWAVADAPPDFISKQLAAIVGIEIAVTRLVGKWKVSQNRGEADRAGVAAGLAATGGAEAATMARLVTDFSPRPPEAKS